jgi:hypothetical protein
VVSLSVDDVSHHDVDGSRDHSDVVKSDSLRSADVVTLRTEQLADPALCKYWDLARNASSTLSTCRLLHVAKTGDM